jgi:putative hydrolase of the HAD superfamily
MKLEWIFFDCMETLVDMVTIPNQEDYAMWSYQDSQVEEFWTDFEAFYHDFVKGGESMTRALPHHKEWSTIDRFRCMCSRNNSIPEQNVEKTAASLEETFIKSYLSRCVVHKEVNQAIKELAGRYKLGVVSNFKIINGVEIILKSFDLSRHLEFIVTSINSGWRKPHKQIYRKAMSISKVKAEQTLFVGDDPLNDVELPESLGMKAVLLDRKNAFQGSSHITRINQFMELPELCKKLDQAPDR